MKKRLTIAAAVGTMLFSSLVLPLTAQAENYDEKIEEAQQQIVENQKNIQTLDQQLKSIQNQQNSTEAELTSIDQTIQENEDKMARLQAELEKAQKEMKQLVAEIDELEENIKLRTEKLAQQARTIQVDGDTANYIEFILEADSLIDVVGRMDVVSTIVRANKTLVQEQQADKKLVVEKKDATAEVIEQQEKSVAALETTAVELEQQKLEKEVLVAQLAAERATIETDREHFLAQKAAAESLVSDYVSAKEETERANPRSIAAEKLGKHTGSR